MATYQAIEFQKELFLHDLLEGLDFAMTNSIDKVFGGHPYFDGKPDKAEITNGIEYDIHSNDFKAWILEYGKGKYMDESNPYLDEYRNSIYWNSRRELHGNAILYRGQGTEYEQLDYQSGTGTYSAVGVGNPDIEVPSWAQGVAPSPFVSALFDQVWTLFGVDSIEIIRTMKANMEKYFVISAVKEVR